MRAWINLTSKFWKISKIKMNKVYKITQKLYMRDSSKVRKFSEHGLFLDQHILTHFQKAFPRYLKL